MSTSADGKGKGKDKDKGKGKGKYTVDNDPRAGRGFKILKASDMPPHSLFIATDASEFDDLNMWVLSSIIFKWCLRRRSANDETLYPTAEVVGAKIMFKSCAIVANSGEAEICAGEEAIKYLATVIPTLEPEEYSGGVYMQTDNGGFGQQFGNCLSGESTHGDGIYHGDRSKHDRYIRMRDILVGDLGPDVPFHMKMVVRSENVIAHRLCQVGKSPASGLMKTKEEIMKDENGHLVMEKTYGKDEIEVMKGVGKAVADFRG